MAHFNEKKFYKKICNRKIRRSEQQFGKGNLHRKLFDLWWTIY